jgi:hypothetical protein
LRFHTFLELQVFLQMLSHFSSLLRSLISGKCKGIFCLARALQAPWTCAFMSMVLAAPLCRPQWLSLCHLASVRSPTQLVLFLTNSVITLFFILWPRSTLLTRLSCELIVNGYWERTAQCARIAQKADHTASSPRRHATTGDK